MFYAVDCLFIFFRNAFDLYLLLCTVRLVAAIAGIIGTVIFSWFESTNSFVETGRSWRARTQQLLSVGRLPPPSQLRQLLVVQRAAAERTAAALAYYDAAPAIEERGGGNNNKKNKQQQKQAAILQEHQQEWMDTDDDPLIGAGVPLKAMKK